MGILILALWAPVVQAYYLELTGSRTSAGTNQLITTGAFDASRGFQIAWHITAASAGAACHYEYTVSGLEGGALGKTLSHWVLEVSNPSSPSDFFNVNGLQEPGGGQYAPATWEPEHGNKRQPDEVYGLKFTLDQDQGKAGTRIYTFSFDTFRLPVWGDFYAHGSNGVYAYNAGFGADPDLFATDFSPWVLVPGAATTVPLPGSVILLGSGLTGLALVRFRRRQKKA